jgi:rhamnogalacturonyl hydrolase YesR
LIATLEALPADSREFAEVRSVLGELAEALVPLQQPDGMWPTLLHRPAGESPRDTSGTAMIATGLARALRAGWLEDPAYGAAADRAFVALAVQVDAGGNVLGVSPGPGPLESEDDYLKSSFPAGNDHGTFAVLFAAAEAARRAPGAHNALR